MSNYYNSINFADLRNANLKRLEEFGHGGLEDGWNEAEWGCAVAGEVGELCNILKKMIRQAPDDPPIMRLRQLAASEIADVAIYLDLVAAKLDLNLSYIIQKKFNEVSEMRGMQTRLD